MPEAETGLAGIGAALFVVIKPPFAVLALALPALVSCVRGRSLRCLFTSENMLGAALTLTYLMWLAAFHRAFLMGPLPMILELYLPMRMPVVETLISGPVLLLGMVTVATWATARPGSMHRIAFLLLLAAWGYLPTFVMLGKGWGYQALPFLTFGLLAFIFRLRCRISLGTTHVLDLVWSRGRGGSVPAAASSGAPASPSRTTGRTRIGGCRDRTDRGAADGRFGCGPVAVCAPTDLDDRRRFQDALSKSVGR